MNNGGLLYAAVDGTGKDANAHEVQDENDGHPSETDYYHTHQVPPELYKDQDKTGPAPVLGRAADGFAIVAAYKENGELYSTKELDAFHGREVQVKAEDGSVKTEWAYCVSQDWPYTVGAFRGQPSQFSGLTAPGQANGPPGGNPPPPQMGGATPVELLAVVHNVPAASDKSVDQGSAVPSFRAPGQHGEQARRR